jgi:tetraacyldisaccharide 4'-kinase
VAWQEFPDHHAYTADDRLQLGATARKLHAGALVCTQKDLVKLPCNELGGVPVWAVAIEIRFLNGQNAVERALENLCTLAKGG